MHKIAQKSWSEGIFKAYDIRGRYPEEINEDAAYKIARAFARYLKLEVRSWKLEVEKGKLKIVVSSDARTSSPALKEAFLDGLLDEGVEIIDAGLTTTPMHYFIVNKTEADGGAMITASHNPAEFNGIKLTKKGAVPIGDGSGLGEIKGEATRGIFAAASQSEAVRKASVRRKDFIEDYINFLTSHFQLLTSHAINIVACSGNGMTSILLGKLFLKFPKMKIEFLHDDLDMTFPNHEADPLKTQNLQDVQSSVLDKKADLGISFDGDGDRVGFVDENGNVVSGDIITALLAKKYAKSGEKIVYDLRSSRTVKEEIEAGGAKALESRVGHAFIKALMRKENAVFGGELSGHYYFRDFFYADSAVFAALDLLDLLRLENKKLSELVKPLLRYAKSEEINFRPKADQPRAGEFFDKIAAYFSDGKISYLDGIKVEYSDWWFSLRLSNTEDFVRLNLEASAPKLLAEKKKLLEELLAE